MALHSKHLPPRLATLLRAGCLLTVFASATAAEEAPRNLLIIKTDEHHFGTLGCYGGRVVKTPHIDSIARAGARCTGFYATTPVCSPSRASFVSGLYPQKTAVVRNDIPLDDSVVTFAELLRRRGYATGFAGKWHLDGPGKPQWSPKRKFGFEDNRFMFNRGHWKKFVDTPQGPRIGARNKRDQPTYGVDGADNKTFATDWLTEKAIDFVKANREKPFCYMLSLPDPHGPNTVRPPYDTMYKNAVFEIPGTLVKGRGESPEWGKSAGVTVAQLKKIMPKYFGMVKCIDDNVGRLLETIEQLGLKQRTVVVFTSDHGDLCGEHGRLNKGVPYEGSARVPFLLSCPGEIKPGVVIPEALSSVDFLPTVLTLIGAPVEHRVDGRDASPLLRGRGGRWKDVTFLRSTAGKSPWLCAVSKRYKLVFSAADAPWLIDLQENPQETRNVFGEREHTQTIRNLSRSLLDYAKGHQDEFARHPNIQETLTAAAQ